MGRDKSTKYVRLCGFVWRESEEKFVGKRKYPIDIAPPISAPLLIKRQFWPT